ncbi:hypothetical protein [Clostridium gasigenes]|uniref:Uncharacterized protein n=1 Tax=Clostridium gasigenes TaxID=94869 RepID=A0A1H0W765_9CLOT|nr:hypothetical protein [Clostridium gasigenes]MBB6625502.1 hypothetical protein [Clostridium gasigenes]MBB6714556.1 hypothetical protein [Clostridium gasigenes]MBU3090421.1 hypothetical protein [Clostridium gasigenes]MBU3106131.1 hypothetical protein [Clostridium gasigenes]MBU3109801.1 hypothetical protein [Clostridium gasigenes]
MKLPMKFRMLQLICERSIQPKVINTGEIIRLINLEYGNERQCCDKTIETHILALKAVGLISELNVYEEKNQLRSEYKSTGEGFKKMKFIPSTAESYEEWLPFKGRASSLGIIKL